MENIAPTQSFWVRRKPLKTFPPLGSNSKCDVCIVGAGIAGLTCAYLLGKQGKKVIVVDDGPVGGGETCHTTAHITNALDDHYQSLEKIVGQDGARLAAQSHRAAIEFIKNLVAEKNIDCHFEEVDAYLFVPPNESTDILDKELEAVKRCGIDDATIVPRSPLATYDTGKSLKFPRQAQFYPLLYIEKLCDLIVEQGGQIFSNTHATDFIKNSNCKIITDLGWHIDAVDVIVATNSPTNNRFFPHLKQAAYRTYVIAGKVPKGYVPRALYYDTPTPYHYIRVADCDENNDYLIVGGEDHRTGQNPHPQELYNVINQWTLERIPKFKVEYGWSGQIIEPVDGVAFIGKASENMYIATGDSGNGITHGTIAGLLISDLIMKKPNPWEKLYDPHRKELAAAKDFAEENLNTFAQYRDWLTPGTVESREQIKNGSGAILREGASKLAIYRDEEGKLHEFSAVCPHLKGLVRWNESEKSWDCPCHGSRFTATGKVVNGPSNQNLKRR